MNKRTLPNLMGIEKKTLKKNVAKYREFLASEEDATTSKREKTERKLVISGRQVKTSAEDDPLITSPTTYGVVIKPQKIKVLADKVPSNANTEVIEFLKAILEQQSNLAVSLGHLENRMSDLETSIEDLITSSEENLRDKSELMAQNKIMCECKVLIKKVHKSICRMTGEDVDEPHADIAATMPMRTFETAIEVEEKLSNKEYLIAMKNFILRQKTMNGNKIDVVIRSLYTDDFLSLFNWDGRCGKLALAQFTLITDVLFDVFNFHERKSYEIAVKKAIDRSHQRLKQKKRKKAAN